MTRQARIAKLEAKRGGAGDGPAVIFRCDAITGEPFTARLMGGGRLVREPGETSDAFTARAVNKLARTYAMQMEALKRYRTGGQQKVTVEHVTVNHGGQAKVGAVTQRRDSR